MQNAILKMTGRIRMETIMAMIIMMMMMMFILLLHIQITFGGGGGGEETTAVMGVATAAALAVLIAITIEYQTTILKIPPVVCRPYRRRSHHLIFPLQVD